LSLRLREGGDGRVGEVKGECGVGLPPSVAAVNKVVIASHETSPSAMWYLELQ